VPAHAFSGNEFSLHDFLLFSKSVTYILMGFGLFGLLGYWLFLTAGDKDKKNREPPLSPRSFPPDGRGDLVRVRIFCNRAAAAKKRSLTNLRDALQVGNGAPPL
jgi:hypothetical protein